MSDLAKRLEAIRERHKDRLRICKFVDESDPVADIEFLLTALAAIERETIERCQQIADNEGEPSPEEMPPLLIRHTLAGDTVFVANALVAAVRATKKAISAKIAALSPPAASSTEQT